MCDTATKTATTLETTTCSRCGGSGQYSYCQQYGTTCFKCAGAKVVYTKRGLAALQYLTALRSKPASELQVGDTIQTDAITMGGTSYKVWAIVQAINRTDTNGWSSMVNGVMTPVVGDFLTIETNKVTMAGVKGDRMFRVAQSAEQKRATFAQALAYQATLTVAGKPRKR